MPIIQEQSPLSAASDAIGSYVQQRDTNRDKALALAMEREKMANEERYRTRSLDLQQKQVESQVHAQDVQTHIAELESAYQEKVRPLLYNLVEQQLKGAMNANELAVIQKQVAEIDLKTQQELQRLGLPIATAKAQLEQIQQAIKTSVAQQHSAEAQTNATTQATAQGKALFPITKEQALANVAQTRAQTALANRTPGGGAAAGKAAELAKDDEADYQIGVGIADEQLKSGKSPDEVISMIRSPQYKISPQVKLRLIRYVQTKPKESQPAQGPGLLQNIGSGLKGLFFGGGPPAQVGPGT